MNQFTVSLWGDEAFSAILSQKNPIEIIKTISHDTSPPLYNLLEHFWFKIFGNSEVSIRSLSFLFFLIAVFFVFKIGKHYWDKKTGILAAALAFASPFFFTYAFEGRMYSLLAATVLGSFYFLLKKNWVLYVVFATAALYTHHFAFFAIFAEGLIFLLLLKTTWKLKIITGLKVFGAIGILYLPWVIPLYHQTKMVGSGFWLGKPSLLDLKDLIYKYLAEGINNPLTKWTLYLSFAALALRIWNTGIKKTFSLLLWFFVPILTVFILSQKFQSIFYDRYMLYTIPAVGLLISSQRRKISILLIAATLAIFAIVDLNYFTHPTKLPFRDLANYVKEVKKGDDYLVNWNGSSHHLWESKYYGIPAPIYVPGNQALPFFVGTALMEKSDIISKIPKAKRVGVITSGPASEVKIKGLTEKEEHDFADLKLIWFQ